MTPFDLPRGVVDRTAYENTVAHLRKGEIRLPTLSELADPARLPPSVMAATRGVGADDPHPANLLRVHWYNDAARAGLTAVPGHLVLERALTGVAAPIVVVLGERFPMIGAHKVLAAYACLVTRLITGQFDPTAQRAIWPSTGNYCRGGVAISRILGCRGVAVLPEGMSRERFEWLENWVVDPADIIRTPGSESNVKEIYDKCAELAADPANAILNQFSEFANYLAHYLCTGAALGAVFTQLASQRPGLSLAAFVAATGSAGILAAGDRLKETFGARIVAVEATQCPTMLYNGYGEHNIQGIGDKHLPLIHNVMNTDMVVGISDRSCDSLNVLFNSDEGRRYLTGRRGLDSGAVESLSALGLSGIANVLAAVKTARHLDLTENDAIVTIATDSGALYASERNKTCRAHYPDGFDQVSAGEAYARHMLGVDGDHTLELTHRERRRIFNLGYFTWVEQQGVSLADFDRRRDQRFWKDLRDLIPVWDEMIVELNRRSGTA